MGKVPWRRVACLTTAGALCCCLALLAACGSNQSGSSPAQSRTVRLTATFSTSDSGLLAAILPVFERDSGLSVEVTIVGSSAAIDAARQGAADLVLTHDRKAENTFVKEGYGLNRRDLMSNDFILLAPPADPAGIIGWKNVRDAFAAIREGRHPFISRGDRSGTHNREISLWHLTDGDPAGPWYVSAMTGMLETLQLASNAGAYVLTDRSTFRQHQNQLDLVIAVENDSRLTNTYSVIAVNPAQVPNVNFTGAMKLIEFLVSPQGQWLIGEYGADRFGTGLFAPAAAR